MSASAAIASPARPIRIPVPPTVPPRRRVPAASGTPPSPPSTPPIAPPSASFQSPSAKPTAIPPAAPIRIASSAPGRVLASQAAAMTATPAPIPAATPIRYHSHIRSSVVLESWLPAGLEAADHRQAELGRSRAVDHAMVEGDRDRSGRASDDLAAPDDRPLGDSADAEDPDLGVVDDRGRQQAAELAGARDGERRASELLGFELVGARRFGEPCDLVSQLVDGARVAVADDRDDEPLVGLHGDAEVLRKPADERRCPDASRRTVSWGQTPGHGRSGRRLLGTRLFAYRRSHPILADDDQYRSDSDGLTLGNEDPGDLAGCGRGDLDSRLVGLDLDERIVFADLLPFGDQPATA